MITNTFFLCNKNKEKERYDSVIEQINKNNIDNCSFFTYIWGDEITPEIRKTYCKTDRTMRYHNRSILYYPLLNSEISLFLNHIECLRYIRKTYSEGYFAIFESDVLFYNNYNDNIKNILNQASHKNDIHIMRV